MNSLVCAHGIKTKTKTKTVRNNENEDENEKRKEGGNRNENENEDEFLESTELHKLFVISVSLAFVELNLRV